MAAIPSPPPASPRRRFTVDEVLRMVETGVLHEDEPLELIDGELVVVTPQGPEHASAMTELHRLLFEAYRGRDVVVREDKPLQAAANSLPEPDVAVVRGDGRTYAKRHPRGDEAVLVVELARTSLLFDRAKAKVYAQGGVPVYWVVDFESRRIEACSEPHEDGHYGVVRVYTESDPVPLPAIDRALRARDFLP